MRKTVDENILNLEKKLKEAKTRQKIQKRRLIMADRKKRAHYLIRIAATLTQGINSLDQLQRVAEVLEAGGEEQEKLLTSIRAWLKYYSQPARNSDVQKSAIAHTPATESQNSDAGFGQDAT
ncbi:MAG: hypothetical protein ABSB95_13070 [Dissulfurispiraceae bacterium]|jgi:hypothetical protein